MDIENENLGWMRMFNLELPPKKGDLQSLNFRLFLLINKNSLDYSHLYNGKV